MAVSYLILKHSGYTLTREHKHGPLPSYSPCSHAPSPRNSAYSLLGRQPQVQRRGQKAGTLTWALNRLKVAGSTTLESEQLQGNVEIPISCYQILGVPDGSSKDQVVKSAMELKGTEIDEGYTPSVALARQEVLTDVRDKLLFEPEFAGSVREHVPPRSSLLLPWPWLPGALCLLQEVGEDKTVLEIGRTTLQQPCAKPYIHDILLSMALAECSIARTNLERGTVSRGFEALARAQSLLRSKKSLGKLALLAEIETSLEELAPTCTLEHLSLPRTPENAERREGALAAFRELLRQGLEGETTCAVRDWSAFLGQAMKKLLAIEIIALLPWDTLAAIRKNNNSLEAQQQRIVIDFNCFYMAFLAHVAFGFSSRHHDMIEKAKRIAESLEITEAINLSFECAVCSTLLGEGKLRGAEDLQKLGLNGNSVSQQLGHNGSHKGDRGVAGLYASLEKWLKDAALGMFADTRDCTPSLASYFGDNVKAHVNNRKKMEIERPLPSAGQRPSSYSTLSQVQSSRSDDAVQALSYSSLGIAPASGDKCLPPNFQNHSIFEKSKSTSSLQLKQNNSVSRKRLSGNWWAKGEMAGKFFLAVLIAGSAFTTLKLCVHFRSMPSLCKGYAAQPDPMMAASVGAARLSLDTLTSTAQNLASRNVSSKITFTEQPADADQNAWPTNDLSILIRKTAANVLRKRKMAFMEAEALVRHWQGIKAESLGPNYEIHRLSEILAEPMLSQWQALAESAKTRSCFWRFVLLHLSIVHAEILTDDIGWEIAEVEAVLEEAAELVDESQSKNPNYYSTYRIRLHASNLKKPSIWNVYLGYPALWKGIIVFGMHSTEQEEKGRKMVAPTKPD